MARYLCFILCTVVLAGCGAAEPKPKEPEISEALWARASKLLFQSARDPIKKEYALLLMEREKLGHIDQDEIFIEACFKGERGLLGNPQWASYLLAAEYGEKDGDAKAENAMQEMLVLFRKYENWSLLKDVAIQAYNGNGNPYVYGRLDEIYKRPKLLDELAAKRQAESDTKRNEEAARISAVEAAKKKARDEAIAQLHEPEKRAEPVKPKFTVVHLKDGTSLSVKRYMEMGDEYALQLEDGKAKTVKKADVEKIEQP